MEWLSHNENFLTTESFLEVWSPSIELAFGVWEQNAFVFCFSLLNYLEELRGDLRRGRDASIGRTSKYQEDILAFFNDYILLFIAVAATSCYWWEDVFIISLSTAVEDSNDEAVVKVAQSS